MTTLNKAWLGLGSNIENPPAQLEKALEALGAVEGISVEKVSSTLVNPAWGKTDQPHFHNLIAEISTSLNPQDLLTACLEIETNQGRVRAEKWGPRIIDIDIIAYEHEVIDTDTLKVPHPLATERAFVMSPLRQIAPQAAKWVYQQAGTRR